MSIPSTAAIRALHERHAPSPEALELVYTHCEIVWKIAEQLLDGMAEDVDRDLVRAGCLLHDIGVYRLFDATGRLDHGNYIRHGLLGHEILQAEGLSEEVCRFCSCHTGVGLTRHDIVSQQLPLPVGDYVAVTREEQLVMYADKFHSKSRPPVFLSADTYAARIKRFGDDKADAFTGLRKTFGEPELTLLAASYGHALT
ncbi:phosphohydrolase [Streptomyces cinnamoneus]|uniref:Phosphohydrolase n=1 Tax=Streptomyces cinnamoneus TaxID=53446 RepID=A0A2G1XN70_STRCJ|nr:HD domain-containing protein [Streptomyces cinnamoneus]PHQ52666.1 phosphohydrolase [Streptomyces cinnamoneus]PPT12100.1 HD domain-containing protein [Streptomyces cinnamoneus]